jgi:phage-related protein
VSKIAQGHTGFSITHDGGDSVLIFHAFTKKSQKTPLHEVALARVRLKEILNEES